MIWSGNRFADFGKSFDMCEGKRKGRATQNRTATELTVRLPVTGTGAAFAPERRREDAGAADRSARRSSDVAVWVTGCGSEKTKIGAEPTQRRFACKPKIPADFPSAE
jgi:hypothetical protein